MSVGWQWVLAFAVGLCACRDRGPLPLQPTSTPTSATEPDRLAELRAFEDRLRAETDFASLPPFEQHSGSNPHRLVAIDGDRFAGLTRGGSQLVLLDSTGAVIAEAAAPASPVDLARFRDELWVVGERDSAIARFRVAGDELVAAGTLDVPEALGLRAIAAGEDLAYVATEPGGAVLSVTPSGETSEITRCHGATQLQWLADRLLVNCMLEHSVRVFRGTDAVTSIDHDGPIWRFAAISRGKGLHIAVAGIEDRPLDRSVKGSFGYIDSFVYLYTYQKGTFSKPTLVWAINVGERGLITPKWLDLRFGPSKKDPLRLRVASYGGDRLLEIRKRPDGDGPAVVDLGPAPPGITDVAWSGDRAVAADPLLDAWVTWSAGSWKAHPQKPADPRSTESKVGELLFFTKLMAPFGDTEGRKSRFTCEACHFEGYVDGRTHHTGRGDVSATSRSLRGLFNNRPHFSRALDRTTAQMIDNEFRVANKLSGHDYWFSLEAADFPWLSHLDVPAELDPLYLRRSLMVFLRDFTNRPNPYVAGRDDFTAVERRGAELFRDRCERCHAARLVVDDPDTRIAFADWKTYIFSEAGPITWAQPDYFRTGITPYVHELGARPSSLRRLYKKWPYFTNGSGRSLTELLERVRFKGKTLVHQGLEGGQRLSATEVADLEAFLRLL